MAVDAASPGCLLSARTADSGADAPVHGAPGCEMHSRGAILNGEAGDALEELDASRSLAPSAPPRQNS
jgi:hypothetical protein